MENGDKWLAVDKVYHVLFCLTIAISITTLLNLSRYPFLRTWSFSFASLVSLLAGAAKEVGDEIGLWNSAGASLKDAIADLFGILLAWISVLVWNSFRSRCRRRRTKNSEGISLV